MEMGNNPSGTANVTIINQTGVNAEATAQWVTQNELRILLEQSEKKTLNEVSNGIQNGQGQIGKAFKGSNFSRGTN